MNIPLNLFTLPVHIRLHECSNILLRTGNRLYGRLMVFNWLSRCLPKMQKKDRSKALPVPGRR